MVIVTSADGFIRSKVCSLLSEQGNAAVAADRRFPTTQNYPQFSGDIGSTDPPPEK